MTRQIITNKTDLLSFGKHKGKSVGVVLKTNPGYLLRLNTMGFIELPESLAIEAEEESESRNTRDTYSSRDRRQYTPGEMGD